MTPAAFNISALPPVRGRIIEGADLSGVTWFRVGGPADVLFSPADEDDLAQFLASLDPAVPVFVMGVGSNLLVRDGGVRGVVIRLGAGFNKIDVGGLTVTAGAAALDAQVAKKAGAAGVAGLEFYRGVPGAIGGALAMNAGAYGGETKDNLVQAVAIDRAGARHVLSNEDMKFAYRHCGALDDRWLVFTEATFKGHEDDPDAI
ncbi:MAG: FAD-binding protein, partial [Pseudomonadota bacterium]